MNYAKTDSTAQSHQRVADGKQNRLTYPRTQASAFWRGAGFSRRKASPFHEPSVGETDDWFTPSEIFSALGLEFDLDPAHPGMGHPHCHVPAKQIYTCADNGLLKPWFGRIWLNPPFGGRNAHVPWLEKFFDHGNGVALCRAYTSSGWFHQVVVPRAESMLFPKGKTKFVRADGGIGTAPGHGVILIGMGKAANEALQRSGLGWHVRVR